MPTDMVLRQPMFDADMERAVLCSLLIEPSVADDVALALNVESFGLLEHQAIYRAFCAVREKAKRPDARLVMAELKRRGEWRDDFVNGPLLAEIAQSAPTAANAVFFARQIHAWYIRRALSAAAEDLRTKAGDERVGAEELLEHAERSVFALASKETRGESVAIGDMIESLLDLEALEKQHGLSTGFPDLDRIIGGLRASELTILAARPGVGKSAFALNVAEHAAINNCLPTLLVSLEMSNLELSSRLLCSMGRVDSWRYRKNLLNADEQDRLVKAAGRLTDAPLRLDDCAMRTASQIASIARREQRRRGLSLLLVDYLQLVSPEDHRSPRQEQVAAVSRRLKALSRELNIPILCLAQLNRQVEQSADMRPKLSHLRESGAIEQDADVVMFLHRQPAKVEEMQSSEVELLVSKSRHGPIGVVPLVWQRQFTRFESAATRRQAPYSELENYDGRI